MPKVTSRYNYFICSTIESSQKVFQLHFRVPNDSTKYLIICSFVNGKTMFGKLPVLLVLDCVLKDGALIVIIKL